MISKLQAWFWGPAHWWQFWLPGSGLVGGLILGMVVSFALLILVF